MYIAIANLLKTPSKARRPYVTVLIPVTSEFRVVYSEKQISPYIEFATIVQQRTCDVLLQNEGFVSDISQRADAAAYLFEFVGASDSLASIRKLARFDNPVVECLVGLIEHILGHKLLKLFVKKALLDMKSQRDNLEQIFADQPTILFQHIEHRLLVAQQPVHRHMVVYKLLFQLFQLYDFEAF